jgi:transcriptional regulator with XRE-family HTH domain
MAEKLEGFERALRALREKRKLTLEELASATGIDASNLSKYETGRQWPSRDVLQRMLTGLRASLLDLATEMEQIQGGLKDDNDYILGVPRREYDRVFRESLLRHGIEPRSENEPAEKESERKSRKP